MAALHLYLKYVRQYATQQWHQTRKCSAAMRKQLNATHTDAASTPHSDMVLDMYTSATTFGTLCTDDITSGVLFGTRDSP